MNIYIQNSVCYFLGFLTPIVIALLCSTADYTWKGKKKHWRGWLGPKEDPKDKAS